MRLGCAFFLALAVAGCAGQRPSTETPGAVASAKPEPASSSAAAAKAPSHAEPDAATGPTAPVELPVTIATAKAHSEGKHYVLDVKAPGTVNVGGHAELEIVLSAKDGFHINEQYPYKLKTAAVPPGIVSFETPELSRAQGSYTKTEATFHAKFSATRAGVAKIGGTIALSVCTKKECITDKIELEVPVTVQ